MKKKYLIIAILSLLLIIDFFFSLKYINDANKVEILEEVTDKDLISKHIQDFFALLKKQNYKDAYDKIKVKDFMKYDEFKNYISTKIMAKDNLISVIECENKNNVYDMVVNVSPPLFSSIELEKQEIYKEKKIKIKAKFNGIFDYEVLEFERVEE